MNTIGTGTYGSSWRAKYFSANLQKVLRKALVAEAICAVDSSDSFYIHNPYGNQPTATQQALTGTYSITAFTVTDDSLTVTDEVIFSEHVFDFERRYNSFNLFAERADEMGFAISVQIDKFVVNSLTEDATSAYTTPAGGFTTSANIPVILANLLSKVAGYSSPVAANAEYFLVLENTDLVGLIQNQFASGFSFADAALRNGLITSQGGIDIYVVRSGTFVDATIGTRSDILNNGHRVFGVKRAATYASPRGVQYDEKGVSGKTGKEICAYGYVGFAFWVQNRALGVDITLA